MDLKRLVSIADVERRAMRCLPRPIFDAIAGGAGDEWTVAENRRAFGRWTLLPKVLVDCRVRTLSTCVFGEEISLPLLLSPAGFQRMVHREAELATARAASASGVGFALSTGTSYALEDVAAVATGPKWFQLYLSEPGSAAERLVGRAWDAGFSVLCLTVDTPMLGMRERDHRNRLTQPFRLSPWTAAAMLRRPRWAWDFLRGGVGRIGGRSERFPMSVKEAGIAISRLGRIVTHSDLDWLRRLWPGRLVVKGVLRGDDCKKLIDHGVDGFVVSNHGGRQLDYCPATIDVLPDVVAAVNGHAEVFVDGGFRRGTDIAKALALGARAVMIGRPYLYGLAIGGSEGVERVLDILRQELDNTLGLLGCPSVAALDSSYLSRVAHAAPLRPVDGI